MFARDVLVRVETDCKADFVRQIFARGTASRLSHAQYFTAREVRAVNDISACEAILRSVNKNAPAVSRKRASAIAIEIQIDNSFLASFAVATGRPYSAHNDATRLTSCALLFASVSLSQRTLSSSPVRQCPPNCNVQ